MSGSSKDVPLMMVCIKHGLLLKVAAEKEGSEDGGCFPKCDLQLYSIADHSSQFTQYSNNLQIVSFKQLADS